MRPVVVLLCGVSAASALGCQVGKSPPCGGLGPGSRVAITFVDSYAGNPNYDQSANTPQPGPSFSCAFGFDVAKGQILEATIVSTDQDDDGCNTSAASYPPFNGWTWSAHGAYHAGYPTIITGNYDGVNGSCMGQLRVDLRATGQGLDDIYQPPRMGGLPPVILSRMFMSSVGTARCPNYCYGTFVVNPQRLPTAM
jgi:hypothetical protein